MRRFGKGALLDDEDQRDRHYPARDLVRGTLLKTETTTLFNHVYCDAKLGWLNQAHSEACCGYGITQTMFTTLSFLGDRSHMGSPLGVYFNGVARGVGWANVTDDGAKPRDCWAAVKDVGLIPFNAWPRSRDVNTWTAMADYAAKQPDPDCYRRAHDVDWLKYHWVLSFGAERKRDCKRLLSANRPFALSLTLDESFADWTIKDGPWKRKFPESGHHYVTAIGYDAGGLWVANSWGIEHGHMGCVLIAWSTIESGETRSIAVPDVNVGLL